MGSVQLNGVELAYQALGHGDQDLLFVHGYAVCSTGPLYQPLFASLAPRFRITAFDVRGHGGSCQAVEGFTLDQLADDILAACAQLRLERPFFVGHSLGGLLGLLAALKAPQRFSGLALLNPAAATGARGASAAIIDSALRDHRDKAAMRSNYRSMFAREVADEVLSAVVEAACLVDPAVHERYLRVEFPSVDIGERLPEIAAPVLVLIGALDIVIPPEAQHRTALGLARFKAVVFSDEGHMLPIEAPERAAREIVLFNDCDL